MSPSDLKAVRSAYLLSQTLFAHLVGVQFTTVNRWENGRSVPTGPAIAVLKALQKIANDGNDQELLAELDHWSIAPGSGEAYSILFSMAYARGV